MTDASSQYDELRADAKDRLSSFTDGKTREVVQVGHTSQALGAQQVADALMADLPSDAYLVIAGDDGASYAAPQVIVESAQGTRRRFLNVSTESITEILDCLKSGVESGDNSEDYFRGQNRLSLDLCGEIDATVY